MSALFCALTGVAPEDPVFSKTGYIFERRVIEKYLIANGDVCPITGEPLSASDLLPVKASKLARPRPPGATSIPGLLVSLQSEWDALMTETFNLRTHLDTVRNQLSHSLYQHDAACRVIARLLKDRDSLRQDLQRLQRETSSIAEGADSHRADAGTPAEIGLLPPVIDALQAHAKVLLSRRKKRDISQFASRELLKQLKERGSFSPHSTTAPGVTCCQASISGAQQSAQAGERLAWTGGVDGMINIFNLDTHATVGRLQGHLKRINAFALHPTSPIVVSASDDKTVRVWNAPDGEPNLYKTSYTLRYHTKGVTSVSIHSTGDYFISSARDLTWAIHDLNAGRTCRSYRDLRCAMHVVSFHPDGMLIGACGMDHQIYIYDVKGGSEPMVALSGHTGSVTDIQFSENGYYVATASAQDGTVKLWDLRRSKNFQTIEPVTDTNVRFSPRKIRFDGSGQYLAICGDSDPSRVHGDQEDNTMTGKANASVPLVVYGLESKTNMEPFITLTGHENRVTDASFGPNSDWLISTSMDRTVKLWEAEAAPSALENQS